MKRWDELLARLPGGYVQGAEVGVWDGRMSRKLLGNPDLVLYMVDRWTAPEEGDSYLTSGSTYARQDQSVFDEVYHKAVDVARIFPDRAHIIHEESTEAAGRFENGSLDFVFIDADHSYQGVSTDIAAWLPKVKPGGLIGGHDYDHPDQGEVKRAVDEFFDTVELGGNRTWWRKK